MQRFTNKPIMKRIIIPIFALLLLSLSECKSTPVNQLRGHSSQDDSQEHHLQEGQDDNRALQTISCGGGLQTNFFKGNISMQSMFKPLNCSATALSDIGRVIDAVFDDVVKSNRALAPLTLNTTVCPTPCILTGTSSPFNYHRRRLVLSSASKYVYRAGKCTVQIYTIQCTIVL